MNTVITYHPSYGPQGEPYSVFARYPDKLLVSHHWTEDEAMNQRDGHLQRGGVHVRVVGLPTRGTSAGFPREPLIEIREDDDQ
jgi:hypothetical protein